MTPQAIAKLINVVLAHAWLLMAVACFISGHWYWGVGASVFGVYMLV